MKNQQGFIGLVAVFATLALIVIGVFFYRHIKLATVHKETFTVKHIPDRDLQVIAKSSSDQDNQSKYASLIYTDHGVYSNEDSVFPWKQRSSDIYNQLEEGKKYTCTVAGWRIGFFSSYKNIVDCNGFKYY